MTTQTRIGVIGSGSWGTALAVLANRAGSAVTLWTRNESVSQEIAEKRENESYLPGVFLEPSINVTMDLHDVVKSDALILCIPAQSIRTMCISLSDLLSPEVPIIIASKGIERGSLALMSEVVKSTLPLNPVAILSGPNFADEAAKGMPTATTLACADDAIGEMISYAMGGKMFRPYLTDDLIGVQIGGAVKNVIAIACGISEGKKFGRNAQAALVTRGLAEMTRLAQVKGGRPATLMGLSGIGDLMLTCSSAKSRNMSFGLALGQKGSIQKVLGDSTHGLTEGVTTAESVYELSMKLGVQIPICTVVYHIIKGQMTVDEGIFELLGRPFSSE